MSTREEFFKKFQFISKNFSENIAVYYVPDFGRSLGITYFEINRVSSELSVYFSHVFENCSQYIGVSLSDYCFLPCILLAIWKSGNSFAGAGEQYTKKSTLSFLDFLLVRYIITDNNEADYNGKLVSSFRIHEKSFFIWERQTPSQTVKSCFKNMCYGIMTSGTTGEPKIIQVPWLCILPNAIELSLEFQVNASDCIFQASPYSFDPFFIELLMTFLNGSSITIVSNSTKLHASTLLRTLFESAEENMVPTSFSDSVENFFPVDIKQVRRKKITILQMTPSVFTRWTDSEIQSYLLSPETSLRILILGGERFPKNILKLKHPANPSKIFNIYGITEISCWAFVNEVTNFSPEAEISLGKPLNTIKHKISENGELLIGSSTRICLINDEPFPETDKIIFRSTGDIVKLVDKQLYYVSRSNEIVKKYGMKINLSKIEDIFKSNDKRIKECCCIYDEDNLMLALFFVPFERKQSDLYCGVWTHEDFCSGSYKIPMNELMDIEKPDYFIELSDIPLNPHGKCDKSGMLQKLKEAHKTQTSDSNLKSTFRRVWAKALGVNKTDLFSLSFTELGGSSVLALDIINRLEDSGVYVPRNFINDLLSGKNYIDCLNCLTLSVKNCGASHKKFKPDLKSTDFKLSVRWKFDLGKCVDATPAVFTFQGEERIVIGSHSSQLSCLNSNSGTEIWSRCLGDRIESGFTPSKDGSRGFIGCYDHFVYCLSSSDGSILWKFKTHDMVKSTPCLSSNEKIVYVGSYDKHLYCLSTVDGRVEKSLKPSNGSICCSGTVSGELKSFYTGTLDGICLAIDQETNQISWEIALESPIFATPCLIREKNEILFAEVLGNVHCLSAIDGVKVITPFNKSPPLLYRSVTRNETVQMWTFKADGNIYSSPVVGDKSIVFGCHDSHLYCLQYDEEPKLKWKQQLDSNVFARPAIVSGCICAATTKGVVYFCDFREGFVKTHLELQGEVFSSPVSSGNQIFLGCRDNNTYSLGIVPQT